MIVRSGNKSLFLSLKVAVVLLAVLAQIPALVYGEPYPEMVASVRGTGSGLPNNTVRAIVRSGDGYIWLATGEGLVRTDGVGVRVFDSFNTPSLECTGILSLHLDGNDLLWVGTDGCGLFIYDGRSLSPSVINAQLDDGRVRVVVSDLQGRIWSGTERGLYCHDGEKSTRYGLEDGFSDDLFTSLEIDGRGRLWAGTLRGGIAVGDISDGNRIEALRRYSHVDGLTCSAVLSILASDEGTVWIGTMEGLFRIPEGSDRVMRVIEFPDIPVTSLESGMDGSILAGTMTDGIMTVLGGKVEALRCGGVLENEHIHSILSNGGGVIRAGTESIGLVRMKERKVFAVTSSGGLPPGGIFSVIEDSAGGIWAATGSSGICRIIDSKVDIILDSEDGLAGNMVRALLFDDGGSLWAGSMDGGLCVIDHPGGGSGTRQVRSIGGLPSTSVTSLIEDRDGMIWIGTDRGLATVPPGGDGVTAGGSRLAGESIRTLCQARGGGLLAGTKNGLWKIDLNEEIVISASEVGSQPDILSIFEEPGGPIWAGTGGFGLIRIADGHIERWTSRDGLPGDFIYSIREGGPLVFWMSCEAGVFAVNKSNLMAYASGSTPLLAATLLDAGDGMPSDGCSGYCDPSSWKRLDGTILYPSANGIAIVDPFSFTRGEKPPVVKIESIATGSNIFEPAGFTRGGAEGRRNIEFRFTAIEDCAPEKCSFIYMLAGRDEKFQLLPRGEERKAVYNGLSPGDYRFIVRAAGNSGQWSRDAAEIVFSLPLPFYRSAAFIASASIAALLLSVGGYFWTRWKKDKRKKNKYRTTKIDDQRVEKVLGELRRLMEADKVFLDPDLTQRKLAGLLKIHNNHLSRIINERFGVSFSDFINRLRIDEAKVMLRDPALSRKNILEIGFMAGFYSKSTFNGAFRKFTGTTPSTYRKE